MYFLGDKVKTEYGTGSIVGKLHSNYIIQLDSIENLPDFILENKHGKGYWLEIENTVILEKVGKK